MASIIWIPKRSLQPEYQNGSYNLNNTTIFAIRAEWYNTQGRYYGKTFCPKFPEFPFFLPDLFPRFFFFLVFFPLDLPDLFTPERGMLRTRSWFSARCYFSWLDKYFLLFFPFFLIFFVQEREENQDNNLINNNGPKYTRDILPTACHARAAVQLVHFDKHNSSNASRWNIAQTKKGRYFSLLRMICP